jgi:predicted ribosome quality control (RQC) complex YloA/Tae2 family protein
MDFDLLSQVVDELSALLSGARLERVYQEDNHGICLLFHRNRKDHVLLVSPDRSLPRLHLVSKKPPAAGPVHGFVLYLRSHLSGARVEEIRLVTHDRVAEFRFTGGNAVYRLVFELFGSAANLILMDGASAVLAVYHPVPPGQGVKRPLLPGLTYEPQEKKARREGKAGPGPLDAFGPGSGRGSSPNRIVEQYYGDLLRRRRLDGARARLSAVMKKALSKAERRAGAVSGDLASAEKADEYRRAGDLILANLARIEKGAEQAELTGYDGRTVTVRLDPRKSPARNADACFRKYKKARAGHALLMKRLDGVRAEIAFLRSLQDACNHAGDEDAIVHVRSELAARGYAVQGRPAASGKPAPEAPQGHRKYIYEGWEILVGKSAAGNDHITTKLARPDDLWLHAEGMAGSHVLIRNPGRTEVPSGVLMKAASLAAYHSKGRSAGKVPVAYTRAKFVRKPRGAKPGLVTLSERKTVMAVPAEK